MSNSKSIELCPHTFVDEEPSLPFGGPPVTHVFCHRCKKEWYYDTHQWHSVPVGFLASIKPIEPQPSSLGEIKVKELIEGIIKSRPEWGGRVTFVDSEGIPMNIVRIGCDFSGGVHIRLMPCSEEKESE